MKTKYLKRIAELLCAGAVMTMIVAPSARAAVLATWDFASNANFNNGGLTNYDGTAGTFITASPTLTAWGGTPKTESVTAGVLDYTYNGSSVSQFNGISLLLSVTSSSGTFSGLSVSYTNFVVSGLTSLNGQWSYRIGNSGAFTNFGTTTTINLNQANSASLPTLTFSPSQTLQLQFVLSGAGGSGGGGGELTFDTFQIQSLTAVPEPVPMALTVFFVVAVAGCGIRILYRRNLAL